MKKRLFLIISSAFLLSACSGGDAIDTVELAVQGLYSADISDDGTTAVAGSILHGGSFWGVNKKERRFNWNHKQGEYASLISVDIDPSGLYALTADERTLVLWNAQTGEPREFWNSPGDIKSLKLNSNGDFALLGLDDGTARYFDIKNGGIKQTFRTDAIVRSVDLNESGSLAVTGDDNYNVILWDTESGEKRHEWSLSNRIGSVALSQDGKYVFGAAQLGNAIVWSADTGELVFELDTGALASRNATINKAKFSNDNRYLLTGEINSKIRLYRLPQGDLLKSWQANTKDSFRPTGTAIIALSFGLDGKYYAIGGNGLLNVLK
ncbi:hypothetical protein CBF23_010485 [Marinomonas agarivorans]|nr:hypothetical protein CBF23_010485 [Marinomonas agarivorans]